MLLIMLSVLKGFAAMALALVVVAGFLLSYGLGALLLIIVLFEFGCYLGKK